MFCPYCHSPSTEVTNSRLTRGNTQIWRRRRCQHCKEVFTTHEIIDLSHLMVLKKSGKAQKYSRMKLYAGIYGATIGSKTPHREKLVDKITGDIEREILALKKKVITSEEIADIVLYKLRKVHVATFLRFLSYCKDLTSETQMKREFNKYTKL